MEERLLITADQIRVVARSQDLAAGVVEKDYALTWLLRGLYSRGSKLRDSFVLKGGTAIRKAYFPETWRFSEDMDFTVIGDNDPDAMRASMEDAFAWLLRESGVNFSIDSFHVTEGAIIANVQFIGPLGFTNRIKHDINLKERMVLRPQRRPIKSGFPDLPRFNVLSYSLTEILVEKIRSIMQRGYSRDYYDVWRLAKEGKLNRSEIERLLVQKCELNGIKYQPKLLFNKRRLDEAHRFWVQGLGYLTKELPEFEDVISESREMLGFLAD